MDINLYKNCLAHTNGVYIGNEIKPYKPCCWFKTGIAADNQADYQDKLSKLDIEYNCGHCIKQEEEGATWSHRQLFNNPKEFVLGVCFDNICNLKCVTCSPIHSSQLISEWASLDKFYGNYDKKYFTRLTTQAPGKFEFIKSVLTTATFDTLRLEIFGGEPLINPTVFKFVDWLMLQPYAPNTILSITTNGTVYTDKIQFYIDKFKHITIQLSIDGVGDTFDYLRSNAVYAETLKIAQQYYALFVPANKFSLGINYTLSWMNSLHFAEFYNWTNDNFPNIHLHLTKLEGPEYYSVNILSQSQRETIYNNVRKQIDTISDNPQFEKIKDLYRQSMLFDGRDTLDAVKFSLGLESLNSIDSIRQEDHSLVFKSIVDLINDTK